MSSRLFLSVAAAGVTLAILSRRGRAQTPTGPATVNRLFTERFDPVFVRRCPGIPVAFLRSLAKHESDFNPLDAEGPAHGLLQVVESVRNGFNDRFGTEFSRADLLDPDVNATIACELIARIASVLPRNHPRALPRPSWTDPRVVSIVALAWNSGFSEAAGMGFVLGAMEEAGMTAGQITIDSIHNTAIFLPGDKGRFLREPQRIEFARSVTRDYMAQISQV